MIYALCFALILVGLYGVLVRRNIVKIIVSLLVVEYGIHLFLVLQAYRPDGVAPIIDRQTDIDAWIKQSVDPVPHALILTSIVIGLAVLALMVALALRLRERYGSYDITQLRKWKG